MMFKPFITVTFLLFLIVQINCIKDVKISIKVSLNKIYKKENFNVIALIILIG